VVARLFPGWGHSRHIGPPPAPGPEALPQLFSLDSLPTPAGCCSRAPRCAACGWACCCSTPRLASSCPLSGRVSWQEGRGVGRAARRVASGRVKASHPAPFKPQAGCTACNQGTDGQEFLCMLTPTSLPPLPPPSLQRACAPSSCPGWRPSPASAACSGRWRRSWLPRPTPPARWCDCLVKGDLDLAGAPGLHRAGQRRPQDGVRHALIQRHCRAALPCDIRPMPLATGETPWAAADHLLLCLAPPLHFVFV